MSAALVRLMPMFAGFFSPPAVEQLKCQGKSLRGIRRCWQHAILQATRASDHILNYKPGGGARTNAAGATG
jgi:hypothetical protein